MDDNNQIRLVIVKSSHQAFTTLNTSSLVQTGVVKWVRYGRGKVEMPMFRYRNSAN